MELRQRLTLLRRQSGVPEATPALPTCPTPDSVAERLQRLRGASVGDLSRPGRDAHVAEILEGEHVADGLVVVERRFPLSYQHGKSALTPITTLHHPSPPAGQALPAEQLVFLDTETTGLSGGTGTVAFLLGVGRIDGAELCLRQFFLTGFRGEAALLQEAAAWTAG
ncbi:MAG TPA: ribonuclease H-like domain-containing protein, partial [Candidatus Tectomicrobia bacterium]